MLDNAIKKKEILLFIATIGFALITVAPFLSIMRVGPQSGFFIESGSLIGVLLFVLVAAGLSGNWLSGSLKTLPRASWYFFAVAIFFAVQARVMDVVYVGQSDMVAWSLVVYGLLAWACRGFIRQLGQEQVVEVLAWVLVLGAAMQSVVGWLQYTDLARYFSGYLMYRPNVVEGQLGQRNHFGHYMMWGVLATAWLWSQKRLAATWAMLLLLNFAVVMSFTGSRTIFAYVLGLAVLLPLWRALAGKSSNRTVMILGLASALVAVAQFAVEPIIQLFNQSAGMESAAERLNSNAFGGSGRNYEWKKAWQVFLSAPLWGYGWGSYAYQGFILDAYPTGFRPYETGVLFTHSHNSFLNMLAEMGIVGCVLIFGGMAWLVSGCLKTRNSASLLLIGLMSVSLLHSVVEYPLWYIYFLSAFCLFLCLLPEQSDTQPDETSATKSRITLILVSISAVAILCGMLRLAFVYDDLMRYASSTSDTLKKNQNLMGLLNISRTEPMLGYYADLSLLSHLNPHDSPQPDWAYEVTKNSTLFRPYANAHHWGFVAYQRGEVDTAREFMRQMYRYYPSKMAYYGNVIMMSPHYEGLREDYLKSCREYYQSIKQPPECAEGLPPNPNKKKVKS